MAKRYPIQAQLGTGASQKEIAAFTGVSPAAVSRELRQNTIGDSYYAKTAHAMARKRRMTSKNACKVDEQKVVKVFNADIHFAKPYASYQPGTRETTNGLIRRDWPKKMAPGGLKEEDLRDMEVMLNTMPGKVMGGKTPLTTRSV